MIVLETDRLFLREWVPDDWTRLEPLVTDPRILKYIGDGKPWPRERVQSRLLEYIALGESRGWINWPLIDRASGQLIGYCGFSDGFLPDVEIAYRLLPEYWGQGLATEAAVAVLRHGFRQWRFPHVIAVAQLGNTRSIRVMEKIGMVRDGQFLYEGMEVVRYRIERSLTTAGAVLAGVRLRPATRNDAAAIAQIYNEAVLHSTATFDTEPKTPEERAQWLQSRGARHPVFVAEQSGKVVAWSALSEWSPRPAYALTAEASLYVAEQHRRVGIGQMLLDYTIEAAREAGLHVLLSRVTQGNAPSIRLCQAVGFARVGTMREVGFKYGQCLDVELLQMVLGDRP